MQSKITIQNIGNGMFQYFVLFQSAKKNKIKIPLIITKKHTHNQIQQQNTCQTAKTNSQKRVKFNDKPIIKIMFAWQFAHSQARKNTWQQVALDRFRFDTRIGKLNEIISPILEKKYEKFVENYQKYQ